MSSIRSFLSRIPGSPVRPRAHFLHIGKTGGTAVRTALDGERCRRYRLTLHSHGTRLEHLPADDVAIAFVRDPLSRFVSGFYSRQRRGRPRYDFPWSPGEEVAFQRFSSPDELARALSSPESVEREAAATGMESIQHVRDHQSGWFGPDPERAVGQGRFLFVGSQENLQEDFDRLKRLLGTDGAIRLPQDPVASHRNPDGLDRSLSPEAKENLFLWYQKDFRTLGILGTAFPWLPRYGGSEPG
jgi:hypothetical protein